MRFRVFMVFPEVEFDGTHSLIFGRTRLLLFRAGLSFVYPGWLDGVEGILSGFYRIVGS